MTTVIDGREATPSNAPFYCDSDRQIDRLQRLSIIIRGLRPPINASGLGGGVLGIPEQI